MKHDSNYEAVRTIEHTASPGKLKQVCLDLGGPRQTDQQKASISFNWDAKGAGFLMDATNDQAPTSLLYWLTETE